ncbi:PilW family protein [Jeongeupia naejangsanensis]|uniref:PilW family protein n=1 Tax=Jeongeupia naejangsanensis TaxID=613195 RepID=A0ABS2BLF3_9NEIS|nr:PilW family protein [Jeongeupia naejangsanensis]MBM3116452.1 PilW family protein [Jeongeupia naejangsanensis]
MNTSRGFTLIELMVTMAIALVVLLAVSQLYLSSKQTYRVQNMQNHLSEDGRFALSMLQRVIGQAGYRADPTVALATDRISGNSGNSVTVKFAADGTNQIDCDGAVAAAGATTLAVALSSGKLQCGTTDWVAPSGSGGGSEVADFKLQYGIDAVDTIPATPADFGCGANVAGGFKERDCIANSYVSTLTGTQTASQIVAVRACLVLRSEKTDVSISKPTTVNDCAGQAIAGSDTDKKLYRTFHTTIVLRNR